MKTNKWLFGFVGLLLVLAGIYVILDRAPTITGTKDQNAVRDIDGVSKIPVEAAALHRENRYENLHSIEQILALPTEFAQTEALYTLAGRSNSDSAQNLIYEANRIADPADRDRTLAILISRLTELDPPSALAIARTTMFSADRNIEAEVWRSWGKNNLEAALAAAKMQGSPGQRNLAAQALFFAYGYLGNETTARIADELGIRPDRTSRARFLYDLADRSPADAVEYVDSIGSSYEQRQTVYWLANYLSRYDPDRAAGYADLFTDAFLREAYSNRVAGNIAAAEPEAVLSQLLSTAESRPERMQVYAAMRELAARDIDSAMLYLEQLSSQQDRSFFGSMIAEELTRRDPARALDWARENDRGGYQQLMIMVLRQIALSEPQLAMEEARNVRHTGQRRRAVESVVRTVAKNDTLLATEFVDQIVNRQERESAATAVVSMWVQQDPEAAINWVMLNNKIDPKTVLAQVGSNLVMTDIYAAIRLLPKLDPGSAAGWRLQIAQNLAAQKSITDAQNFINQFQSAEDYNKLRAAVVGGVAQNNIFLAKQLADQLPAGTEKDSAYAQLVSHHANTNPIEAAAWLASISNERQRRFATSNLVGIWYSQDPDATGRWADNLPRGPQRDDAIVSLASSWQEMTPSRQLLVESIGDSEKQTQAKIARIHIVAQTDWQKAQTMLTETDMGNAERQRIQNRIDYYRNH